MPRKGHKGGCQCIVCRAMQAREAREAVMVISPAPILYPLKREPVITAGSLRIGEIFKYKSPSGPIIAYKKVYEAYKMVTAVSSISDTDSIKLPSSTPVEIQ